VSDPANPFPPEPPKILPPEAPAEEPQSLDAPQPWQPGRENPRWTIWDVVRIVVVVIVSIAVLGMVATAIALHGGATSRATAADIARDPRVAIPAQFAAYLVVIAYMLALIRGRASSFWQTVRWNWPGVHWLRYAVLGVMLAFAVEMTSRLLPIPKSLPIDKYFRDTVGAYMMAIFGVTLAPLVEELFFRGFLYPVLARKWGMGTGIVVTAALFAFIHESQLAHAWAPLLLLFGVGLVLTTVRARTGSVGATFAIHVGYNAALFTSLYFATDHFRHLERMG
jgi:hypothetical protein